MGAWGPGIFENDPAEDIRLAFADFLEDGCTAVEAIDKVLAEQRDYFEDQDDRPLAYVAAAALLIEHGVRVHPTIIEATRIIESSEGLSVWREANQPGLHEARKQIYDSLYDKLIAPPLDVSPLPLGRVRKPRKRAKLPYSEGDWFAVPISNGFVLGRIARVSKKGGLLVGYFFKPPLQHPDQLPDLARLRAQDAFYIRIFGDLGLLEDGWPILHRPDDWVREEWPMPLFGSIQPLYRTGAFCTKYDESTFASLGTWRITPDQAMCMPDDGMAGHLYLSSVLDRYFIEGSPVYDPANTRRIHTWFHGLPTIADAEAAKDPLNN